jgi:HD-like signal output (HDOD) protein
VNPHHLTALIAVLALLAILFVRRKPRANVPATRLGSRKVAQPLVSLANATPLSQPAGPLLYGTALQGPTTVAPDSLLNFEWQPAESLPESRREAMLTELKKTPPPPRAFYQLVSPDFVAKASSAELAELVIGVPLAATKVLARVNSAFYGLNKPVGSVGHAVTFLGLNSVRAICLQYMMDASFKAQAPALRQRFDQLWAASAIASELSQKLSQRLQLPEAGDLVTEVALSSLGHFAAATLMPREGAAASSQSLLSRTWSEQAQLGAPAAEIGALLMRAWDLPEILVEQVRAIDRVLVKLEPQQYLRLAVCYLSARLGERMTRGDAVNLNEFA